MKTLFVYIRLYLLFLFRIMLLTMGVEIAFYITVCITAVIRFIIHKSPPTLPPNEYVNLIAFAVATILAMQTTYFIDGRRGKVWSDTFGFDPEKFKEKKNENV